jgi:hypothetical protein
MYSTRSIVHYRGSASCTASIMAFLGSSPRSTFAFSGFAIRSRLEMVLITSTHAVWFCCSVLPLRKFLRLFVINCLAISPSGGARIQFFANAEFVRCVDSSRRSVLARRTDQWKLPFSKHGADAFQQRSTSVLLTKSRRRRLFTRFSCDRVKHRRTVVVKRRSVLRGGCMHLCTKYKECVSVCVCLRLVDSLTRMRSSWKETKALHCMLVISL